jgi:taurine dioxygenase
MTFRACPPLGSILHGIVIPSEPNEDGDTAGDTEFFSMAAAFNALDPVLQSELTGMTAEHSFEKGFAVRITCCFEDIICSIVLCA